MQGLAPFQFYGIQLVQGTQSNVAEVGPFYCKSTYTKQQFQIDPSVLSSKFGSAWAITVRAGWFQASYPYLIGNKFLSPIYSVGLQSVGDQEQHKSYKHMCY